jgi:tetratricopeptide (TPR) repeat protein
VGAATLGLLLLASAERPVLACVDDVHWLDGPSLDALVFAGRRLAGAPVGMVLAARDEPHPTLDAARLEQLGVPALDRGATGRLASRLFSRLPDEGGVDEIFRRTQGLPLAIVEWSRLGEPDEVVATPVPISRVVERAYARGVEAAPAPVRAMLLVAAVDDSGDLSTVLAAAARLDISATAVQDAEELGLIEAKEDARLSAMTGGALTICGRLEAAEPYLRRSIELAERADPFALVYAATSHGWLCNYRAARDLTTRALESGQQQGAAGSEAFASEMLAEYENALGEHDAAGAIWSEGARKAEEAEQPHPLAWCRMSLALIAANREGEQQARRLVDSALQAEQPLWYMAWTARPGCSPRRRLHAVTARPPLGCLPTRTPSSARSTTPLGHRCRPGRGASPCWQPGGG